jgi:endonuclease-3
MSENQSDHVKTPMASRPRGKKSAAAPARKRILKRPRYTRAEIHAIFARFHAANPEPTGELHYVNPYTLLVAVALSAQATDVGVNKATRPLFETVDTPEKMLALGEDALREAIRTIGLYKTKAKNVIALSRMLVDEYGGQVPQDRAALERLPGVGRKTANVVLNIAFGQPTIAVDTHLFRLGNRIGLAPGKTPLDVEKSLEKAVPAEFLLHAHHWLILHGRYICKARKPECEKCLIADLCKSPENTQRA